MDDQQHNDDLGDDPARDLEALISRMDPPFDGCRFADLFADQYSALADASKAALQPQLDSMSIAATEPWKSAMSPLNDLIGLPSMIELMGLARLDSIGAAAADKIAKTIKLSGVALGETARFDNMFESITASWKSPLAGLDESISKSLMDAYAPMQALTGWADSINVNPLGLAGTSAAAEIAKSLDLMSGSALADVAGLTSTLNMAGLSRTAMLDDHLAGISDWLPAYKPPARLLASDIELPDFSLMGNPLLETTIELAELNAAMGQRIDEQTVLIREMRDEMAGLRQRQVEADLRQVQSDLEHVASAKRDRRLTSAEVIFAFLGFVTAVVAIVLGLN